MLIEFVLFLNAGLFLAIGITAVFDSTENVSGAFPAAIVMLGLMLANAVALYQHTVGM